MTMHTRVGAVWKDITEAHVRVGAVWKKAEVWVKVAGVWKQVLAAGSSLTAYLANLSDGAELFAKNVTSTYRVDSDGYVYMTDSGGALTQRAQWMTSGANTDFEVRVTETTGNVDSGTVGTWLATNVDNSWTVTANYLADPHDSCTFTVEIRDKVTLDVLATATIVLWADSTW